MYSLPGILDCQLNSPQGSSDSPMYSPPGSLDSPVYSSPGSRKFDSSVCSLPQSRDSPVYSTQGIIDCPVYSLPGCQRFDSPEYSLPWSQNSLVYHYRGVLGVFTTAKSFFTVLSCFIGLAFKGIISKKINNGWFLIPIGKRPIIEKFTSLKPFRLTHRWWIHRGVTAKDE